MLIQFSVENFLSFKEVAKISFVGNKTTKEFEGLNTVNCNGEYKTLKSNVIFGANASGKSNFISAIAYMKKTVLESFKNALSGSNLLKREISFKLNPKNRNESSFFEAVFTINEIQYRYGFEIYNGEIEAEWLLYIPEKIETVLFEREGKKISLNKSKFKEGVGLDTKTRSNVLFLSVCSQFDGKVSDSIIEWFRNINIVSGIQDEVYRAYTTDKFKTDKRFKNWLNRFIDFLEISKLTIEKEFIEKINIDELNIPEDKRELKDALIAIENLRAKSKTVDKLKSWHKVYNDSKHLVDTISFDFFAEESKGTQKLIYLLGPIYDSLVNNRLLIVDELDARLHTILTENLINIFHKGNKRNAQFLFVLHDTNLLKKEIFRRDQVWFTNKNQYGESTLYSLDDYKKKAVRNDAKFNKKYLEGEYGSIPYIDLNLIDELTNSIYE